MTGIDRHTGKLINGYASALQSVEVIFSTPIGERVMRRYFGGGVRELLGRAVTPQLFAAWQVLLAVGIDLWEPRFRVRAVLVNGSADELRLGRGGVTVQVDWRPGALRGDLTVESIRSFAIGFGAGISVRAAP